MTAIELENVIGKNMAILVDTALELTGIVSWERAISLVIEDEAYTLIPRADGSQVRSQNLTMPFPLVVALNHRVKKFGKHGRIRVDRVSKKAILERDHYTCRYCGEYGDTIDHIIPRSRGGLNTLGNFCCACSSCNGSKADMTPEEAGMILINTFDSAELQTAIYERLQVA